jgi:hypothetical protein
VHSLGRVIRTTSTSGRLDAVAIEALRRGESGAARYVYAIHGRAVATSLQGFLGDGDAAHAVCAEVFRDLAGRIDEHDPRREPLREWMLGLALDAAREWSATGRESERDDEPQAIAV